MFASIRAFFIIQLAMLSCLVTSVSYAEDLPEVSGLFICAKFKGSFKKKIDGKVYPFYKGELFKVVDRKKTKTDNGIATEYFIQIGNSKVKVSKKRALIGDSKSCGVIGKKVLLNRPTISFYKITGTTESSSQIQQSGEYVVSSLLRTNENDWVRILVNDNLVYVKLQDVKFEYSTDEMLLTKNSAFSLLGFHLYLEFGWSGNNSSERLNNLLTEIPDSSDVSELQDPLVTELEKGSGFYIGAYSYPWAINDTYSTFLGLGYQKVSYTYNGFNNEDTSPHALGQLSEKITGEVEMEDILLKFGVMRNFEPLNIPMSVSLLTEGIYTLTPEPIINAKIGCPVCIGKREPVDNIATQKDFDLNIKVRTDIPVGGKYRLSFELDKNGAFTANFGFLLL